MRAVSYPLIAAGAVIFGLTALAGQAPPPAQPPAPADPPAPFTAHTVATGIRGGYQVVATDMNKDGKIDLIGLGSAAMAELLWYENPAWTPHVITRSAPRMINLAAADTDGDGIPELALAYEFSTAPAQSPGKVAILKAGSDPREPWTLREIDAVPTSHRIRFATIGGQPMLINAPILGATAQGQNDPDHTPTPLRAYRPPDWKPETITEANQGVVHGLFIGDWDGDGRDDVLTAGYVGVFAHSSGRGGGWARTEIVKGDPAAWPRGGASDVAVGVLNTRRLLVTNEPFHGNQVVVYQEASPGVWPRTIIDTRLNNSHSLTLVDTDGDGNSEIVSGGTRGAARGVKPGVFFYKADAAAQTWQRMLLDPGIAANSCVTADINGDRRMDVACIDNSDPFALKWYENSGK